MKNIFQTQNIFGSTRWKLDTIAALFIFIMLLAFSYAIYYLLTIDIIYQATGEFSTKINETILFENFKQQTIFLLTLADTIIFIVSIILFDKMVVKLLAPIEYLSNVQKKFAENVSHELRTPLSIMNMHGEILLNKIEKNKNLILSIEPNLESNSESKTLTEKFLSETKSGIETIQKEILNITNLIDDLLFEARLKYLENKDQEISILDLEKIIRKIITDIYHKKNQAVTVSLENNCNFNTSENQKHFQVNQLHLERILNNLISNSFKFTTEGQVKIILENYQKKGQEYLRMIVTDTGLGIAKEDLSKVGERFFRAQNVENKFDGTGVGLAIVSDLAKNYGWDFQIQSQENSGTTVEISKILLI